MALAAGGGVMTAAGESNGYGVLRSVLERARERTVAA